MRESEQADLRRQVHRRMAPVAVRENSELAARRESLDLVLRRFKFLRRISGPGRQALRKRRRPSRIGLRDLHYVDPIERGQVVEMDDVIVQRVMDEDEIADILRVRGNLKL